MDSKKEKVLSIILILFIGAVSIVILIGMQKQDRTSPVIHVPDTAFVYHEGEPHEKLLEDITATDNKDGAVKVLVENIYPLSGEAKAKVYYVAMDSAGNISKVYRIVEYIPQEEPPEPPPEEPLPEPEPAQPEAPPADADIPEPEADPAAPVIILTETDITMQAGQPFSYMEHIADITDDTDDFYFLARRISVKGADFNTSALGTYTVEYLVIDSDDNYSEPAVLTVHVQ